MRNDTSIAALVKSAAKRTRNIVHEPRTCDGDKPYRHVARGRALYRRMRGRAVESLPFFPSLSIVIEWENAKNSEAARAKAMLREVFAQVQKLANRFPATPEAILIHDSDEALATDLLNELKDELALFPGEVRTVATSGLDYYDQKNCGAQAAINEAVLLVDSDVIPSPDWLETLLTCFVEEGADVACGATHLTRANLYEKAFAAFWFFPLPSDLSGRSEAKTFFANNVIFRAALLKQCPFPAGAIVRGKCVQLAEQLRASGKSIIVEPAATVTHPPPNGPSHFFKRALCAGQDNAALTKDPGAALAVKRFVWNCRNAFRRLTRHRAEIELSALGVIGAIGVAASYHALEMIGELVTLVFPRAIQRSLRV